MKISQVLRPALIVAAIIGATAALGGCKDTPTTPNGGAVTKPKAGSTYSFATYDTDSLGAKVPGSDSTRSFTCIAAGVNYAGKSDVYEFAPTTGGDEQDTVYMHYESNGDVSQHLSFSNGVLAAAGWITIPFASKTATTTTLLDSNVIDPDSGIESHVVMKITTSGSGSESITVPAGTFTALKGTLTLTATVTAQGLTLLSMQNTGNIYFVPSIGYAAKTAGSANVDAFGTRTISGSVESLTSYTVK